MRTFVLMLLLAAGPSMPVYADGEAQQRVESIWWAKLNMAYDASESREPDVDIRQFDWIYEQRDRFAISEMQWRRIGNAKARMD